ncbi:MAG: helix-turn-helix domain-containing protein [Oxalobacter formigenes]|nr:helix-turn-helix domain-containing protein [Oxalobacter formigenes]
MNATIGQRIKELRTLTGLKPEAYAKIIGVSRPALLKWENGYAENLRLSNLISICKYHSISLDELIVGVKNIKSVKSNNPWPFPITYEEYMELDGAVKEVINGAMLSAVAGSRAAKKIVA